MVNIGIFDSGVGGLTVMREIVKAARSLSITYFGDTARLPYGDKSAEAIIRFSRENVSFLTSHGVSVIVVACSTASSLALDDLQSHFAIPVIGVVAPAIKKAIATTRNGRIGVLGTRATVHSGVYQRGLLAKRADLEITAVACPLFVPLVEERLMHHEATKLIARDYLESIRSQGCDTVILGCTHYPLLADVIQGEFGDAVALVDGAVACAEYIQSYVPAATTHQVGTHRFFVSDDPQKFQRLGEAILGQTISGVTLHCTSQDSEK